MSIAGLLPATMSELSRAPTHVVGIGASAGGLQALERFFDNVPASPGVAFVVVQHLSPNFKSLMDELLARHTALPITLVEDGMRIEANHVYLIPPKKEMIISEGRLLLSERAQKSELQLPIDTFFRSLAQDCGPRAVAIVLSGGGSDGSRGVRDIYERGGLVLVQDTASAQFDGMPKTAREAGVAHWVLAPEDMPRVIVDHVTAAASHPLGIRPAPPEGLDVVYQMLENRFGIDFKHYKPTTVTRRIERRLQLAQTHDIGAYVERLKKGGGELDSLYRDLLIGVTRFFRNEAAFTLLEQKFLPELFRRGPADHPLRVWIAGCATGEEAYSLAILLHEIGAQTGRTAKIFASDVHRGSLEIASRAIYDEAALEKVSRERLERYFLKRGKNYQVVPDIRQTIVFAPHNVINDAPFTRVDLISCRNLLIYLQPPAQQKVFGLFHFALNRGGLLFLGPSETPGGMTSDFETLDRHWHVYRKFSDVRMPVSTRVPRIKAIEPRVAPAVVPSGGLARYSLNQLLATYDTLLDEHMPPSLLVSERGELVHSFGGASKFLKLRDGRQDLDVLDVVEDELKMVLAGGLKRAEREASPIVFRNLKVKADGQEGTYDVSIRQVKTRASGLPHLLVSITETHGAAPRPVATETEIAFDQVSRQHLGALEAELNYTKENLQAAIEELESSNEELQASNEELLASNEELQSTNEELQSVNEELYTVNSEYQRKIAELTELTNDMDNLLSATDVGTIFLDKQLTIRKFTPPLAEKFNLLQQDVGRSIENFTTSIEHPELVSDLQGTLATGKRVERELRDRAGRTHFMRILPYLAKGNIDGVVLTLIDVTGLKAAEDALFHERHLLHSLLSSAGDAIYFSDARGRVIRTNHAMALRWGVRDPREAVGKSHFDLEERARATVLADQDDEIIRTGDPHYARLEPRVDREGEERWDVVTRLPMRDPSGRIVGVIAIFRDVTAEKRVEEKVRESVRRRDQFLAMLSHELRNPLGAIVTATALLQADGETHKKDRMLDIVQRQSQQMARLLDDLLEASRVTQNKIELRKRVLDLRSVARDALDAVRGSFDSRRISLVVELDDHPVCVNGDAARLQQIQVNLLSNAAKYTPVGGEVMLSVKQEENEAVLTVRDTGAGIPPDMLEAVFDLFVQSRRTLERSDGGLGLGLTLVRSLVTMHGGHVTAHSEGEGKGTMLVVRLPLLSEAADEAAPARSRLALPSGAKIVLVEDNEDSREMLCELLALSGFECVAAGDGRAGLAMIRDVKPRVAIIDLGLPEIDGHEVARALRDDPSFDNVYLIALTGYGQREDRAAALEAGFNEHLVKPVDAESLRRLLAAGEAATERQPTLTT